jgi:pimeloyl-ACP methyl ester carboxylesterase
MFLTPNGGPRVALHDLGGDGPAVLICHATGFCGRAYEPLAGWLAKDFHVWAIDFAGHGDSDLPKNNDFAWLGMIDQLIAVKEAIGTVACVIGHSMGAAVALQAAANHPGLFPAAYMYEPALPPAPAPGGRTGPNFMAEGARRRQANFPTKAAAMWRYSARSPMNQLDAASMHAYVEHGFATLPDGTASLKCIPESEARTFESAGGITVGSVSAATLPTLCVSGGEADSPIAAMVPPLAEALPRGELRIHRHLGHFGPLQSPGLIADEIRDHVLAQGPHTAP